MHPSVTSVFRICIKFLHNIKCVIISFTFYIKPKGNGNVVFNHNTYLLEQIWKTTDKIHTFIIFAIGQHVSTMVDTYV